MKTFGRVAWLVAGYVLLALASGASPRTSRASVALGQTVPTHHCVSDITNLTGVWNATDLVLNRRNPAKSTGTLMVDAAYDYEGGVTENELPKTSTNTLTTRCLMKVIVEEGKKKALALIVLGDSEDSQIYIGIQKKTDQAGESYSFTGAELMDLIIQRASEDPDVTSIPANQFKLGLSVAYEMGSTCTEEGKTSPCADDDALAAPDIFDLKKGNGSASDTDFAPGYHEIP